MSFTVAKGEKNMCAEATDVTVILEDVVRKMWSQNMLTKQRAIFWDHFGVSDSVMEKARIIVSEPSLYFSKLSNAIKPGS